ncbi:MAG: AlpA family phage regulatory protein [Acidobacteriaceae bacterium]|nr:AlpA family phage regulatory protein [Acidobacteriota bacterium]MBV9499159.1 AlpA family phage regulatory protein [Acidobacteriaceae bacterium]
MDNAEIRALRRHEVLRKTGLSRVQLDRLEHKDLFPKRFLLSERIVAWLASEVDEWLLGRAAARVSGNAVE